ncbi:HPr family phosphocarrier protein [Fusibacter bizertensis]
MKVINVTVHSETGLHARPASQFVSEASKYLSDIKIEKSGKIVNGKSIMNVLSLCVSTGDEIKIIADGQDEEQAIRGMSILFEKGL